MVVSLKPERLKRYKDVAMLLIKYGRSDLISAAGLEGSVLPDEIAAERRPRRPRILRRISKGLVQLSLNLDSCCRPAPIFYPAHILKP